ncbi:MAG: hypothetical protein DDG60_00800 [Anaerolineae bacterium]|nr:MAG: hypothetical protein DDG60_00800 [Anaerolineae bacterium]
MKKRCSPRLVQKVYSKARSWRKTAETLNDLYGVNLSHQAWRDYATGRRDIANQAIRAALGLEPRACPTCGRKYPVQLGRFLAKMTPAEWDRWHELRRQKKYKAARHLLEEISNRKRKGSRGRGQKKITPAAL